MVYVQNRSPHQILEMKTPEEAYSNKGSDVGHFRIFGSSVYFHVTKDAWNKLEPTTEFWIFVGYTDTPQNSQVYMLTSRMIVVYRDIRFDEEKAMGVSLERELELHADEEILAPKQARRAWYTRIDSYFIGLGFTKSEADANLYHIVVEGKLLIIVLYVDDLILTGDEKIIKSCKEDLVREFEMKDMGLMHYFLGMEVCERDGELFVSQGNHDNEILRRFHMESSKTMETPLAGNWRKEDATSGEVVEATVYRQLLGSLMYLVNTRLDMCYVINQLSQAMIRPTKMYWKATKHVLRYHRGTTQFALWYKLIKGVKLQGFTDVDWAGNPSNRKSTSGGIFSIGLATISWYNRKQRSVALSSLEAEYMAAS
eukprot:PITA_33137